MTRGKSLLVVSTVCALLALLASSVGAGELGVCPPYSKTFEPDDPPEAILDFLAEADSRPGGGTMFLAPGDYGEALSATRASVSGTVCIRRQPNATGFANLGLSLDIESGATLTLRSVQLYSEISGPTVAVEVGGRLFAEDVGVNDGFYSSTLSNSGSVYAVNSAFPRTINNGILVVYGGQITEDDVMPGLDNSGYAFLDGVRLIYSGYDNYKTYGGAGIRNRASGVVSVTRSTIADNGSCCWYADACGTACGDGGIVNTEGGYVEIAQSIVANNIEVDCLGPVADLGYNVFGRDGDCVATEDTSLEADPHLGGGQELLAGSPAIDLIPLDLCPETDALGRPRTDGNGDGTVACDAGALEFTGQGVVIKSPPFSRDYGLVDLETDTALYLVFMSSAAFDPADVVVDSVVLNDTGAVPRGYGYVDRNGDGVLDLRLRYKLTDVPLVCGEQALMVSAATEAGDTVAGELKLEATGCVS